MSREDADKLFKFLESRGPENELKNLWLMSPFVRKVFHGGHIRLIKNPSLEEDDGKTGDFGEDGGVSSFPIFDRENEKVNTTLTLGSYAVVDRKNWPWEDIILLARWQRFILYNPFDHGSRQLSIACGLFTINPHKNFDKSAHLHC